MDIRNVQKTGNMYYVYLPTAWCKEQGISPGSKVTLSKASGGSLLVSPKMMEKKSMHLELQAGKVEMDALNKLIVACYINPADAFKIHLEKSMDYTTLLNQKRLLSTELVEVEGNTITCESSIAVTDPDLLLKTMVNKIKNLLLVMMKSYNLELIQRYEEEIDKNRLLIDKAIISSLTFHRETKLKTIELYYIALISKDLERMVDYLILLEKQDKKFFEILSEHIAFLKETVEMILQPKSRFTHQDIMQFIGRVNKMKEERMHDIKSHYRMRIKHYLSNISEVLLDWTITRKIENP